MFLYASFNRPLWIGFDPGVWFKIVNKEPTDMINGRMPHNVIATNEPISPEKIKDLELTDYQEVAATNKLIEHAKGKLTEQYLKCVIDLIKSKKIVSTDRIDDYATKAQKIQAARKEIKFSVVAGGV